MTKLALTLTAATFVLGLTASSASAQTQQLGAASMQIQLNNGRRSSRQPRAVVLIVTVLRG